MPVNFMPIRKEKKGTIGGSVIYTPSFTTVLRTLALSFYSSFAALKLTQRTSTAAFSTKTKAKIQLKEFAKALKLVNEWRMVDPEVRKKP